MPARTSLMAVGLLWLSGVGLRLTILAIPPVIPLIHADFHLSATEIGFLSSVPVAVFALAALPGSLLVARFGAVRTLVGGLLIAALGSGLRGASSGALTLYATTILMGAGVAVAQPAMPAIVRQWLPTRIGFATAVYSNGLLSGAILPLGLTIPCVLPLVGGDWRTDLLVWSVSPAITAVLVATLAPRPARPEAPGSLLVRSESFDWRSPLIWRLGILFGSINTLFFATNAFLPHYLDTVGRPDLISNALTALSLAQLPAALVLLGLAGRLERQAWPYVAVGGLAMVSIVGLVTTLGAWTFVWAGVLGMGIGASLTLGLTLPALLSRREEVARTSAGMFTISYAGALVVAVIGGAAWDVSGIPALAFAPIAVCAVALSVSALSLRARDHLR